MNEDSIKTECSKVLELLDGTGLNYIININNAAIVRFAVLAFTGCMMILALQNPRRDLPFSFDPAVLAETIKCNVTGLTLVTSFLLPAMENSSSKVIVNMSSSCQYQQRSRTRINQLQY
ncbi:hypothetical protein BDR03DRAFT_971573 [Suillus americanus]|nr:hypothetical protein BDR03DRAFT_971573 [Suillus americanus]